MGRFSSILVLLLGACGDNLDVDGSGLPDPVDEIDTSGNATPQPRFVPAVCGSQTWATNIAAEPNMSVSAVSVPEGVAVLATPRAGGTLTGFVLDRRMNMLSVNKIPVDGSFTHTAISRVNERLLSTAITGDGVFLHLHDHDLGSPQYLARLPGSFVAEPAFYKAQADLVMPIVGEDGLWLHRFDDSFQPTDSKHVLATDAATSMTAAQMGVAMLTAWSTASDCHMMLTSTFHAGPSAHVAAPCEAPRLAVNSASGEGVMVFDSHDGVRLMHILGTQFGGSARLLRDSTSAPRAVFDGRNFWISYLDTRGDIIIGFLDDKKQLVTMSLAGPKPQTEAYELVMVDGAPWVISLADEAYTAHRMCFDRLDRY